MKWGSGIISRWCNVACLALVLILALVYIRQTGWQDTLAYSNPKGWSFFTSSSGGRVHFIASINNPALTSTGWFVDSDELPKRIAFRDCNWWFHYHTLDWSGADIAIPVWVFILMFAIKPIWSFIAWRRRRKLTSDGHQVCASCGYDLHGIENNRCPECGEGFTPSPPTVN